MKTIELKQFGTMSRELFNLSVLMYFNKVKYRFDSLSEERLQDFKEFGRLEAIRKVYTDALGDKEKASLLTRYTVATIYRTQLRDNTKFQECEKMLGTPDPFYTKGLELNDGEYFLLLETEDGFFYTERVVIDEWNRDDYTAKCVIYQPIIEELV